MKSLIPRRKATAVVALAAALALLTSGCAPATEGNETPGAATHADTINWAASITAPSLDPLFNTAPAVPYLRFVYDTLIRKTGPNTTEPGLATKWEVSEDGLSITLELREGLSFQDGTPFDSAAVVAHFERGKSTEAGVWLGVFQSIKSIEAPDKKTVVLHLVEADPVLLDRLAFQPGMITNPNASPESLRMTPDGIGPWVLDVDATIPDQKYVFVASKDYWDTDAQATPKHVVTVMTEQAARINALRTGQVDLAQVTEADAKTLEDGGLVVSPTATPLIAAYNLDPKGVLVPALKDERVWQAMSMALDRETMIKTLYFGRGAATASFGPGHFGHSEKADKAFAYDPKRAKELLAEAGYPDGFTMTAAAWGPNIRHAMAMIGQWEKVGIKVKLEEVDIQTFVPMVRGGKTPLLLSGVPAASPYEIYKDLFTPKGQYNPSHETSAEVDAVADAAAVEQDRAKFEKLSQDLMFEMAQSKMIIAGSYAIQVGHSAKLNNEKTACLCNLLINPRGLTLDK